MTHRLGICCSILLSYGTVERGLSHLPGNLKLAILLYVFLAACGRSDPLDVLVPGEHGRVVRVLDGDALVLDTGQSVRLVGLEAPVRKRRDRPAQPYAEEAARMLEDMALGRRVQLYYAGLTRDRYDRALAHVVTDDALGPRLWLNRQMALQGGARVRTWPDTALAAGVLVEAEADARSAARGLWSLEAYKIAAARELPRETRGFVLVEGLVGDARRESEGKTACRRPLLNSAIRLDIRRSAGTLCALETGHRVRVRGWLSAGRLDVTHPANLEVLPRGPELMAGGRAPN